jgi:hypothetical protein
MTKPISELFTKPSQTFSNHLRLEDNFRILFSGSFGIGKTTFANYFFEQEKERYNVIHLYPVNYSVLENEDIFKYIKYDILVGLLTYGDKPSPPDYNDLFKDIPNFLLDNFLSVFGTMALLSSKLGRPINQFIKELHEWKLKYKEYSVTSAESEDNEISALLKDVHSDEGGLYEYGYLTNIIINWLRILNTAGKENILVIDDLDRIDPNHIFRILNVFSAHFDTRDITESKNKFGFDKVILICDIDNIKNIYQAQYGMDTDFNGYVDKFYSKEIYRFDNRDNLFKMIESIVDRMEIGISVDGQFTNWGPSYGFRYDLILFLEALVSQKQINLRAILKYVDKRMDMVNQIIYIQGKTFLALKNNFTLSISVLSKMLGNLDIVKQKFDKISELSNYRERHNGFERMVGDAAMFAGAEDLKFSNYGLLLKQESISFTDYKQYKFVFDVDAKERGDFYWSKLKSIITLDDETENVDDPNFYRNYNLIHLLNSALENITE